uniref:BAR domain-containing protein n=1 Tax=Meloidogyne hapla TaxID=6305 RepID=A0A1I8AZ96_MELHA
MIQCLVGKTFLAKTEPSLAEKFQTVLTNIQYFKGNLTYFRNLVNKAKRTGHMGKPEIDEAVAAIEGYNEAYATLVNSYKVALKALKPVLNNADNYVTNREDRNAIYDNFNNAITFLEKFSDEINKGQEEFEVMFEFVKLKVAAKKNEQEEWYKGIQEEVRGNYLLSKKTNLTDLNFYPKIKYIRCRDTKKASIEEQERLCFFGTHLSSECSFVANDHGSNSNVGRQLGLSKRHEGILS